MAQITPQVYTTIYICTYIYIYIYYVPLGLPVNGADTGHISAKATVSRGAVAGRLRAARRRHASFGSRARMRSRDAHTD